ncbi:MAG: hypothetical protein Q9204_008290, partial [Flavoplaca sp. TL-2023a]
GKSSVLEGLTGLPFPRDSALCTRFATQITFRRALESNIVVTIIPDKNTTNEDATRMKAWRKEGLTTFDREDFSKILAEAHNVMGIGDVRSGAKRSFSDDVLKIEVAGPKEQHLSVVDVPGIFRKITEGLTTQSDIANVRAMAERYMSNPRSVILAVIPANVDIATQEILEMAKVHDREGRRTLGVLTKPDLVDRGAEDHVVNLVRGTNHKMKLGWCIVKNPGQQDLKRDDQFDRHALEAAFFKNETVWSKLDRTRVGIASLRLRLVDLLTEIVRREFGNVRAEVVENLKAYETRLKALGPCRETKDQQQKYLLDLATRFQVITTQALEANYGYDDIFDSRPSLRIATAIVNRYDTFSEDVWQKGLTMAFKSKATKKRSADAMDTVTPNVNIQKSALPNSIPPTTVQSPASFTEWQDRKKKSKTTDFQFSKNMDCQFSKFEAGAPNPFAEPLKTMLATRYHSTIDDLDDLLYDEPLPACPKMGVMEWVEKEYKSARGFELGTIGTSLLQGMWKKQSSKWENLALGFTSDCIVLVHSYIRDLLEGICEDNR